MIPSVMMPDSVTHPQGVRLIHLHRQQDAHETGNDQGKSEHQCQDAGSQDGFRNVSRSAMT